MASFASQTLDTASAVFKKTFGGPYEYAVQAPGRVNLIGEHTDYSGGFVMPLALERVTVVVGKKRADEHCRVVTSDPDLKPAVVEFDTTPAELKPSPQGSWINYVSGVVAQYKKDFPTVPIGFDIAVSTTVPLGSGLSSSAALEVAVATLIEAMYYPGLNDPVKKALRCQATEHEFVGTNCGIMDQFISALGKKGHALLIDCRSYVPKAVPLTDPSVSIIIINTNVKHSLVGSPYNDRRANCEEAAALLNAVNPSIKMLRDAKLADLDQLDIPHTGDVYKRAHHVITEDDRCEEACAALEANDYATVGELMYQSHESLRVDFEVSTPELDALVKYARDLGRAGGVFGARMTGGGFGGCIVALVERSKAAAIAATIVKRYKDELGFVGTAYTTSPGEGAKVVVTPEKTAAAKKSRLAVVVGLVAFAAITLGKRLL